MAGEYRERVKMNMVGKKLSFYSIVICAITIGPGINYLLNELIKFLIGGQSISSFIYIVLALMGITAYPLLLKKPRNKRIELTLFFVTVVLILSAIVHPYLWRLIISNDFNPLNSVGLFVVFFGFPLLILCGKHNDWDALLRYLFYFSIVDIALATIVFFFILIPGGANAFVYMSFSYSILFPGAICAVYGYKEKKLIPFIISFVALMQIFLGGARGSLLCMLVLYILIIINTFSYKTSLLYIALIVVFLLFSSRFFDFFMSSSESLAEDLGIYSRTLNKIADGELFKSTGRNNIKQIILEASLENPLGYGLLGDRYILAQHGYLGYAHSIIWEFICDFGWFLGPFLLVSLLVMIVKTYIKQKFQPIHYCFLAMLPSGFIMLFMSGSFLEEFVFWAFLGLLYNSSSTIRKKSEI